MSETSGSSLQSGEPQGLNALFVPRSIAVIGASADKNRIGGRIVNYLNQHYQGAIYPINPIRERIQDLPAYISLEAIGGDIDLALISIPAAAAVDALQSCAETGVKAAIVFSSGFSEAGKSGELLQQKIKQIAEQIGMLVLGPNCLGAMDVHNGVTATFSLALDVTPLRPGNVAVVSQSGAFAAHILAMTAHRSLCLSKWITTGNEVVTDCADIVAFLAGDPLTDVIMLYLEGCRDGAKLRKALEMARRVGKPVVAIKVGRSEEGTRAALSHTAALTGSDQGYDALFDATGVYRAKTIDEFIDVAAAASIKHLPLGRRVGLISMSGGVSILMADRCQDLGMAVPQLSDRLQSSLARILPHSCVANPIDVTAQIINEPGAFGQTVEAVLQSGECDALAIFLTTVTYSPDLQRPLMQLFADLRRKYPDHVIGICMLAPDEVKKELSSYGYIQIDEPSRLIETIAALAHIHHQLDKNSPVPPASDVLRTFRLNLHSTNIGEHEAKTLLSQAGLYFARERLVTSAEEAAEIAAEIGFPVALKLASPDVTHKSEIGGVILNLADEGGVETAFKSICQNAKWSVPHARVDGIIVSQMITDGIEMIVGGHIDDVAGPLVTVGAGGIFVEILYDITAACAPVCFDAAMAMIARLQITPILEGARGRPKADQRTLAQTIVTVSQLIAANADQIEALEINPLIVRSEGLGVVGVDALIVPGQGTTEIF